MSVHLSRAQMLLQQSRPAEAEREAGLAIAQDPRDPMAHALIALCRVHAERGKEALEPARAAVGLAPDIAYFHYVHAFVLHHLDRESDALVAAHEAIRLAPEEEDNFALRASIQLARRDWNAALADAEAGLALNPEHVESANLRAMALVRLGRNDEATATVDYALERAPENALSHANQGWTSLHRNDPRRAQEYFREALRLDPELEYARQGMLEALKARNPIYRGMLAYFLWMGRQTRWSQWGVIIGTYLTMRILRATAEVNPALRWVLIPVIVLFYLFIFLTWTAGPIFNLLLRFDRFGRLVLSREERHASNWFGASLLAAAAAFAWIPFGGGDTALVGGIGALILSICISATWSRRRRARRILGLATGGLAAVGAAGVMAVGLDAPAAGGLLIVFLAGFFGFQILANAVKD